MKTAAKQACRVGIAHQHRDQVKRFTAQVAQFQCLNLLIST